MVNLYYSVGGLYPRGVPGMTKVNSTPLSYPHVKNSIFFRKAQPPEQHLLADVWDGFFANHKIVENTADVPNQGDFSATDVHALTGTSPARFCLAPDETVVWCDGVDNYIWGGKEGRIGGFINFDPMFPATGAFYMDYTTQVTNTLTDAANRATLRTCPAGLDKNAKAVWLLGDATDSSVNAHTFAEIGAPTYSVVNGFPAQP